MWKFKNFIVIIIFCILFSGCEYIDELFLEPQGKAEIYSKKSYYYQNVNYCDVYVKVTNTGERNIYNSCVSVKVSSTNSSFCSTATIPSVIPPGKSVFITVDFMIIYDVDFKTGEPKRNESWKLDTASIVDEYYE